ncbi:MAG: CvpA family protein [Gammaproteobacteria bacterium]|nr:CvpA family protein [Gammaproteobacteria bacterium]
MPVADIVIAIAIAISVAVGFVRGFVKEAISIASLLIAIWAALHFGPRVGSSAGDWLASDDIQKWLGWGIVFVVILSVGGLLGWGVSKLVRLSVLSGTDRLLGLVFGFCRGAVLMGVAVLGGQFAGFDNDSWWDGSHLIPYGEQVADWIRIMAPKGMEALQPGELLESIPVEDLT